MHLKELENKPIFKIKLIYFIWRLITLQYCGGFGHTMTWINHGCTWDPHPETPSLLPPHPIPLGCPSALALSALFHALNMDWSSVLHMVNVILHTYFKLHIFNAILSNHPTLAFSHKVQKSVLYICVSFANFKAKANLVEEREE